MSMMNRNRSRQRSNAAAGNDDDPKSIREKIVDALNNPAYRSRTLPGIARETRLSQQRVIAALHCDRELAATVKLVPMRTQDGRLLLTTKDRFSREATFKELFVDFFASKRPELPDVQ